MHIKDIRKGPIIHKELPPEQVENLRWIWERVKDVEPAKTFEEFELDFCRDMRPEREIAIWLRMTVTMLEFLNRHPGKHTKQAVFFELLAKTTGVKPSKQFSKAEHSEMRKLIRTADQHVANWVDETPSADSSDDEENLLIALVAEYRGVALCEIKGDRRAVWEGVEYQTDGNMWLIGKGVSEDGFMQMTPCDSEREAKTMIDGMSPTERNSFRSIIEANDLLGCPDHESRQMAERLANGLYWRFDEEQGVFIPQDDDQ